MCGPASETDGAGAPTTEADWARQLREARAEGALLHSEEFEGWCNRETEATHRWLYAVHAEAARVAASREPFARAMLAMQDLVDLVVDRPFHRGLAGDLLGLSLTRVHWSDVVQAFREKE